MAKTDVLKYDLKTTLSGDPELNLDEIQEPFPVPKGWQSFASSQKLEEEPPVTTLVSDEERVKVPSTLYSFKGRINHRLLKPTSPDISACI